MSKNRLLFTHSCNAVEVINAHTIGRIEELAGRYQERVREYPEAMRATGQAETAEQVFNSNAIENSTLTLQYTEDVLSGIARKGLQLREVYEAKNLAVVVESQLESVDKLSVDTILRYHSLVLRGIADERAGRFRRNDEWVRTGGTLGANPAFVATLVEELVRSYPGPDHFLAGIAQFHLEFKSSTHSWMAMAGSGAFSSITSSQSLGFRQSSSRRRARRSTTIRFSRLCAPW